MSKLILLLIVIVAIHFLLRARKVRRPLARKAVPEAAESFIACARCGINIPRSEAVEDRGRHYCGEEHRQLG